MTNFKVGQKIVCLSQRDKWHIDKKFLFFKSYPEVQPGSEIVVPKRLLSKGLSTGEVIGISSALASLAGVVIAILNLK